MHLTALKSKLLTTFTSTSKTTSVPKTDDFDSFSSLSSSTSSVWTNISNPKSSTSASVSPWTAAPTSSASAWTTSSTVISREPNKAPENLPLSAAPGTSMALAGVSHNVVRRNFGGLGLGLTQRFEKKGLSYTAMMGWRR